jgi:hypothetical protein
LLQLFIDSGLDHIVTRAMRKNPDERYRNIIQLRQDLARYEQAPRRVGAVIAALVLF